tara:strand:+ start:260 stop:472 length:213 start_codon:yes stop_codon:yes gene_type:complete
MIVTLIFLLSSKEPSEADRIPFPKEETTPPVTKRNLGLDAIFFINQDGSSVYQKKIDTSKVSDCSQEFFK